MGNHIDHRYNIDGFLTYLPGSDSTEVYSYCQLFSNGTIESVASGSTLFWNDNITGKGVFAPDFEKYLFLPIKDYLQGYKNLGVSTPVVIILSFLGCKGYYLDKGMFYQRQMHPIDRNTIILPDIKIENLDTEVPRIMKPICDAVWNACGFPRSLNYDEEGNYLL